MHLKRRAFFLFYLFLFLSSPFLLAAGKPTSNVGGGSGPFKPFDEVTQNTEVSKGLFNVYRTQDGKVYLEIGTDQMDAPFLFNIYLTRGVGIDVFISGVPLNNFIFEFHRAGHNVQFVEKNTNFTAAHGSAEERAVKQDYPDAVMGTLPILSINDPSKTVLVDATGLFLSDLSGLSDMLKDTLKGPYTFEQNKSYIGKCQAFPLNVEIDANEDYGTNEEPEDLSAISSLSDWRNVLIGVRFSFSKMPKEDYTPRLSDDRVGYFVTAVEDFSSPDPDSPVVRYINRWNMKNKPIVFWIQNTTPKEYRDAVKAGVLEWNKAFARIGIPDALEVKVQPDDADWQPGDIRYNVIYWTNSDRSSIAAVGPSLVNPRTGEIYNAAVVIDGEAVRRVKYLYRYEVGMRGTHRDFSRICRFQEREGQEAQRGILVLALRSPNPAGYKTPESLLNAYIKNLVMHEVGHCLGLRHNFHASTMLPLDEIYNKKITEKKGLAASVMDYLPFNVPPLGKSAGDYFDPTIGPYDYWAIAYGYTPSTAKNPNEEKRMLSAIASQSGKPDYAYETDEDTDSPYSADPMAAIFDLSNNPLAYAAQRLALYRSLFKEINKKLPFEGKGYDQTRLAFDLAIEGYKAYMGTPLRYIGGEYFSRSRPGDPGGKRPLRPVDKATQLKALSILDQYLFSKKAFVFPPELLDKLAPARDNDHFSGLKAFITPFNYPLLEKISAIQDDALDTLFRPVLLYRLLDLARQTPPGGSSFTLADLFNWMTSRFFSELETGENISETRRALQNAYIRHLILLVVKPTPQLFSDPDLHMPPIPLSTVPDDARNLAEYHLVRIRNEIQSVLRKKRNRLNTMTVAHLKGAIRRIHQALDARTEQTF